jgi:hypothetical protein
VPAGHRLRVAVSSAYWPLIWPSPETAELRLTEGAIDLPVRPITDQDECRFSSPEMAPDWQVKTLREASNSRRVETDLNSGIVSLLIEDDFGMVQDLDHGLIAGSIARERWMIHPDDPLSARGFCEWIDEIQRDETKLRTVATCEMSSDLTHFHLSAQMKAYENDTKIKERDLSFSIPRDQI